MSWRVATGYHDLNKMPPDRMHEEIDILCSELSLYPNAYLLFLISCALKQKYNEIKLRRLLMFLMTTRNPFLLRFYFVAICFNQNSCKTHSAKTGFSYVVLWVGTSPRQIFFKIIC